MNEEILTSSEIEQDKQLAEALQEAAKILNKKRKVPKEIWEGMKERQALAKRSLKSKTKMSGPL